MIITVFIAALAAVSTAQCQEVTETVTRCTTSYSEFPAPTGSIFETSLVYTTVTNNLSVTSTTQQTITVTPVATTFTDVVNTTTTFTTTVTSVPAATTVSAPVGFFPLINTPAATPAAFGRHRRALIETRAQHLEKVKRLPKTPEGNTGGFIVLPNGQGQSLKRIYPVGVTCRVTTNINSTETIIVTGVPKTEVLVPATATAVSTSTMTATETVIEIEAQPTEYAACQPNNVVSNVPGFDNRPLFFDRIVFIPVDGFPIANSLVVNTTSAVNCCIACQNTPFCAGSFYAPSIRACHLQLTQAAPVASVPSLPSASMTPPFPLPSSNTSLPYLTASGAPYPAGNGSIALYPTATGRLPSGYSTLIPTATPISSSGGMSILPIAEAPVPGTVNQPGAGTCSAGSMSLYLGKVYGQSNFPADVAMSVSNGPCGRMSIDFEPQPAVEEGELGQAVERRWIAIS
ncbi:uncharacterized protein M421DRAFT_1082 [Didymella exigua CBS 183.55]|uniref:Apple domain-containing protein n=1 Tax=Didymella exigua CBS 183.55 TaxID=1150837 RepID=A0A6A5S1P8_9PLEO|nr:uncharacterized protein M421DRAFT_1082 [Didymella exigua CBS 183.55]KAF1933709.1 hypothetical protein M421DRAFT_1082 [Didymella exigua CBS 183.55]